MQLGFCLEDSITVRFFVPDSKRDVHLFSDPQVSPAIQVSNHILEEFQTALLHPTIRPDSLQELKMLLGPGDCRKWIENEREMMLRSNPTDHVTSQCVDTWTGQLPRTLLTAVEVQVLFRAELSIFSFHFLCRRSALRLSWLV